MIGLTASFTIILNYTHLQQLTINDCLRLATFLTGIRVSSIGTDLVLIYESVTSTSDYFVVLRCIPIPLTLVLPQKFSYNF
jgi:hypothetical protein